MATQHVAAPSLTLRARLLADEWARTVAELAHVDQRLAEVQSAQGVTFSR